ncbi:hypothetical protein TD95_002453 [Thielaviopsis punctulata]|uniref:Deacetylase sirtuin-type domain-containing protein n=1 Tax=Thielaviopsis punctulata TaxID=72032 RepID=A0A0F4Z9N8_9PEZI|nr:hypothetical protein TD95_002453 [Thielaviopsis punctulata]
MRSASIRIPYRDKFPSPAILPPTATTIPAAIDALVNFFTARPPPSLPQSTVVLSGAGLSVASGLADYRGENGTYRVNKTYRPIFYNEFVANHAARKRYWARSFLGWTSLQNAAPNPGHYAVGDLGRMGFVNAVITQNVDSFHHEAHPLLQTTELHGYLRAVKCITCKSEFPRDVMQDDLARLNPIWAEFLREAVAEGELAVKDILKDSGKLSTRGIKSNPDGDMEIPGAPYQTFRYPPCPRCLESPTKDADGLTHIVRVDADGAWDPASTGGVLKPAVVQFGENIRDHVKDTAQSHIDNAGKLLVLGTSLATYSAWRLARSAKERGMPIAIVNIGGVRGEEIFHGDLNPNQQGAEGVRVELPTHILLPQLVDRLWDEISPGNKRSTDEEPVSVKHSGMFKEMMS